MAKTTTDLDVLKINYLTQAQYESALSNEEINENELYITPSALIDTIAYTTTIPTADNLNGLKFVLCNSEPETKYNGWIYLIKE